MATDAEIVAADSAAVQLAEDVYHDALTAARAAEDAEEDATEALSEAEAALDRAEERHVWARSAVNDAREAVRTTYRAALADARAAGELDKERI